MILAPPFGSQKAQISLEHIVKLEVQGVSARHRVGALSTSFHERQKQPSWDIVELSASPRSGIKFDHRR
ncbi:hypothetical protein VTI28DRAFT_8754 [Corynascus sepedonium]